ncbi:acetyl-CoA carboxylase biotin carboxyl carrier protein [Streptomyces albus subsp. chlorinus]|nr:acetyl-CoA carboxylase biotin carboxyl carrier protein [Streptomyces albus subsp. chlorinus]
MDALVRSVAQVASAAGVRPSRLAVRLGQASIEVDWNAAPVGAVAQPEQAVARGEPEPAGEKETGITVRAPLVGTFYAAPEPGAPPFVEVGDEVKPGQQVAIIEAMKLMNPVEAQVSGRVAEVLVGNGGPVEYDQPLLVLEPLEDA